MLLLGVEPQGQYSERLGVELLGVELLRVVLLRVELLGVALLRVEDTALAPEAAVDREQALSLRELRLSEETRR